MTTRQQRVRDAPDAARVGEDVDVLTRGAWRLEPGADAGPAPRPPGFGHVLVALDGSGADATALAWAGWVCAATAATATVVCVVPPASVVDYWLDVLGPGLARQGSPLAAADRGRAARLATGGAAALRDRGITAEGLAAEGAPAPQLVRLTAELGADLLVLGTHSGGLDEALLGSVGEAVRNHAPASVLVARNEPPPRRALIAVDGSRGSKLAAAQGLRILAAADVPASLLHVVPPLEAVPDGALAAGYRKAMAGVDLTWSHPEATAAVQVGDPAPTIVAAAANEGCGLVVLGCRGLSGLAGLAAGSVSGRVAREAAASVLVVKEVRR